NLLTAGWLGLCLGLYALGDSLVALFGVTLIRDRSARLEISASFGGAAERILALRAVLGRLQSSRPTAALRSSAASSDCGRCGRSGHTSVPLDAVLVGKSRCLHSAPTVLGPTVYEFPKRTAGSDRLAPQDGLEPATP